MQFAYDEDQELLRTSTRRFLEDRHPVLAVRERIEAASTFDRPVWTEGAQLGWTAMLVPVEHDGGSVTAQPVVDLAALAEELGRQLYPGPFLEANVVADVIARFGSDAQRKEHLAAIARGDVVASFGFTEDGTTDLDAVTLHGEVGDGTLRLDGAVGFVHAGSAADLLLVAARTGDGVSLVLVPSATGGVTVRALTTIDVTRRFARVSFEGATVPLTAVVGTVGGAVPIIEHALRLATVVQACEVVGAIEHLFERTVQYAKDRVQFGRPIGSFQAVKHKLANLLIEVEAARAAARYAALAVADDRDDRDEAVAVAGSYVREAAAHVCGESLQLHGGIGFTWEHDVHLFLRRVKADQALYGDAAWHRDRLVAILEHAEVDR